MKKIISAALTLTAVLCFSILPLSSEKGAAWYSYGDGSELQSDIQAERGVYFHAPDFGLVYPVNLHGIAANMIDEGYTYTFRVYDLNSDSLIYEEVFPDASTAGFNYKIFSEPLVINRDFTVSMTPESSGMPKLGHSGLTLSEHSFFKTIIGNWESFAGLAERYEWDLHTEMSNFNDLDAPRIVSVSGLQNSSDVEAEITITVQDDSPLSEVYGEYDLGSGWIQFTMTAAKTDYTYIGTMPGQPEYASIPVRFYMKDENNNSGYSSTYTARWTGGLPINVTISYQDSTVTLNWAASDNVEQYYIYSQNNPYAEFALIDSTASTTWNGTYFQTNQFFYVTAEIISVPDGFVLIPGGTFQMGDSLNEGSSDGRELPVHSVTLSNFYMGKYEVTQSEWATYMPAGDWSSFGTGDNYPAYYVSWYKTMKYCNLRSMVEGLTPVYTINSSTDPANWGTVPINSNSIWNAAACNWSANGYRLPTEAEWEYAARGGLYSQRFPNGATISHSTNGDTQANYKASTAYAYDISPTTGYHPSFNGKSSPVGSFPPNEYGLYDMAGNLLEMCWDWYSISYYSSSPSSNPTGPTTGSSRVMRGGIWYSTADGCRVAFRNTVIPYYSSYGIGFRLARTP